MANPGGGRKPFVYHDLPLILTDLSFDVEKITCHKIEEDVIAILSLTGVTFMTDIFSG